jgi:hypothetical protein
MRVVDHFTQQENTFARIFFDGSEGNLNGIFDAVTKTKMTWKYKTDTAEIQNGWGKILLSRIELLAPLFYFADNSRTIFFRNVEFLHDFKAI